MRGCSGARLRRSRPPVPDRYEGDVTEVTFRVTPELRARVAAEAERQGRRISDVAREALERYLAS
jgi:predicted DNA-binding protein